MRFLLWLAIICPSAPAAAQQAPASAPALPIQDNSFLVEEAYNQERGVVQHISAFARTPGGDGWAYTFTQEWPVASIRHQLSYTLPVARTGTERDGRTGVGDIALNYRYQVERPVGSAVAFAPRLTLILPTGESRSGLGAGSMGAQVNLPMSVMLPASIVVHSNVGGTWTPRAQALTGSRAATVDFALGQSFIWLAHPKLNLMLEAVWSRSEEVAGPGRTGGSTEFLLSPGFRGAIDFPSGLQVVPGLAFPIGVGPSRGERLVFAYLSFEHAFTASASQP